MAYKIEEKLVIGVASSALFQLDEADSVFRKEGLNAYRDYQYEHQHDILNTGVAFPFVKRLLAMNQFFPDTQPIEVVLLSHNDPDTGLRVFYSIQHYGLNIIRAAFTTGDSPFKYIPAYNVSLFLSANSGDVRQAMKEGYPAGQVLASAAEDDPNNPGLCIAFDFDGVIADSSAEEVYQKEGIEKFYSAETEKAQIPHTPGPLADLFSKLAKLHKLEDERVKNDPKYRRYMKMAIVTARSAPAHERVVTTLRKWDIPVDQTFFLGGMDKGRILSILRPHIFFDDQRHPHLDASSPFTPSVHIPLDSVKTS